MGDPNSTSANETRTQQIGLDFLTIAREHRDRLDRDILLYVQAARREGVTWEAMGKALGMTGAGVSMMVRRAEKAAK